MIPLPLAALLFAVLWTGGMIWWSGADDPAGIAIWVVAGALCGLLWFWLMRLWMRRRPKA